MDKYKIVFRTHGGLDCSKSSDNLRVLRAYSEKIVNENVTKEVFIYHLKGKIVKESSTD